MTDISINTTDVETTGTVFYARPYNPTTTGFYFTSMDEYATKKDQCCNAYGQTIEEFKIKFIDGEEIDAKLFYALSINQETISSFINKISEWDDCEKHHLIIAIGECGYVFNFDEDDPFDFYVDFREAESLRELAEQFVEEGLYGPLSDSLKQYIDYDAIAYDLAFEYREMTIAGTPFVFRCA